MTTPAHPFHGFVVAGSHSGVGKTTISLGLMRALSRRGLAVQPFKVGPDFIDPLHHSRATGRPSRNLDSWMLSAETNRKTFAHAAADADVAIIEGVMGLFDGTEGGSDQGSGAEMARLLDMPIVLVIDASAMARSAAALIYGFTHFADDLRFAGVVLNRVGGEAHAAIIREALDGRLPILGWLPIGQEALTIPERHLGLELPEEQASGYLDRLADFIEAQIEVGALFGQTRIERPDAQAVTSETVTRRATIAVARDAAFCFYYEDNFDLLRQAGAQLVFFSPLQDELPAGIDGLYLGGGYPELYADRLQANVRLRRQVRAASDEGMPILAECGGLMYLAETLTVDQQSYDMCNVLACRTKLPAPLKMGYTEITTLAGPLGSDVHARGHVYHHSELSDEAENPAFIAGGAREGFRVAETLASYVHLHFGSCPKVADNFVSSCARRAVVANR
jgi:cobyrinic acid a,c-diamide synthase